ncbi:uncharacterized protein LOC132204225 [Neocloeon triangulifer]|uniref:uncharacterized protein LOC132204225 n=1 Tax=Neocloeon triangulifer TaxID=2078957 RepID=UPI00286F8FA6|nr:uncharacterized protein LOC132204225 [Neocloeon triangulifer]
MLRFYLLHFIVLTTVLAEDQKQTNQSQPRVVEEFQAELTKNVKETNQKLDRLMRLVYDQAVEIRNLAENENVEQKKKFDATNLRLENLSQISDERYNQTVLAAENFNKKLMDLAQRNQQEFENIKFFLRCPGRLANLTTLSNGKKYLFSYPTYYGNWNFAKETCSKNGLQLATIRNLVDAHVVVAEIKKNYGGHGCWVSAKNSGIGGRKEFRWHDGTKLELSSPLWTGGVAKNDECVFIYDYSSEGKLNCNECTTYYYFICELPSECY